VFYTIISIIAYCLFNTGTDNYSYLFIMFINRSIADSRCESLQRPIRTSSTTSGSSSQLQYPMAVSSSRRDSQSSNAISRYSKTVASFTQSDSTTLSLSTHCCSLLSVYRYPPPADHSHFVHSDSRGELFRLSWWHLSVDGSDVT